MPDNQGLFPLVRNYPSIQWVLEKLLEGDCKGVGTRSQNLPSYSVPTLRFKGVSSSKCFVFVFFFKPPPPWFHWLLKVWPYQLPRPALSRNQQCQICNKNCVTRQQTQSHCQHSVCTFWFVACKPCQVLELCLFDTQRRGLRSATRRHKRQEISHSTDELWTDRRRNLL